MTITKEQQEKIDAAIKMCESAFTKFFEHLDGQLTKEEATKWKQFLLQNTFFAGGVFRSHMVEEEVNDIDVFFRTEAAAMEFATTFLSPKSSVFPTNQITQNNTFCHTFYNNHLPKLCFVTMNAGQPEELLGKFDFTFNQHYYSIQDADFDFDLDTFKKKGMLVNATITPSNTLFRVFKFMEKGYKLSSNDVVNAMTAFANQYDGTVNQTSLKQEILTGVSGHGTFTNISGLTGMRHRDRDINYQTNAQPNPTQYEGIEEAVEDMVYAEEQPPPPQIHQTALDGRRIRYVQETTLEGGLHWGAVGTNNPFARN